MANVDGVGTVVEFSASTGVLYTQVRFSNGSSALVETSVSGNETPRELVDAIAADAISAASGLGHTLAGKNFTVTEFVSAG